MCLYVLWFPCNFPRSTYSLNFPCTNFSNRIILWQHMYCISITVMINAYMYIYTCTSLSSPSLSASSVACWLFKAYSSMLLYVVTVCYATTTTATNNSVTSNIAILLTDYIVHILDEIGLGWHLVFQLILVSGGVSLNHLVMEQVILDLFVSVIYIYVTIDWVTKSLNILLLCQWRSGASNGLFAYVVVNVVEMGGLIWSSSVLSDYI